MSTDRSRRREAGTASVEAVLAIPFLLFITLAVYHSTQLLLLKGHTEVQARTAAWKYALTPLNLGQLACPSGGYERHGGKVDLVVCGPNPLTNDADRFLADMESKGGDAVRDITQVARTGINVILPKAVSAKGVVMGKYEPVHFGSVGELNLITIHEVDARGTWTLGDLPIGYDRWMRDKLGGAGDEGHIFEGFFPKVNR